MRVTNARVIKGGTSNQVSQKRLILRFEFISVSLDGSDQNRSTGIIFQLLPEREDVYIHRATICTLVVAPHCTQEFRS